MNIIVCVKRVPLTREIDLHMDQQKTDIKKKMLAFTINEWDNSAVYEAIKCIL